MTRKELIEVMARAMCKHEEFNPDDTQGGVPVWRVWIEQATAALAALEAAGVRLVPVEPTVGMFRELTKPFKSKPELEFTFGAWALGSFAEDYRAMLAASPYAPKETGQ